MRVPEEFETKQDKDKEGVPGVGTNENEKDNFDPNMYKPVDESPKRTYF